MILPLLFALALDSPSVRIVIDPNRVLNRIQPAMYGTCMEDVNHEIYGGLYAQRIFGESFEEPGQVQADGDWHVYGGDWMSALDAIEASGGDGFKLVFSRPVTNTAEVKVRVTGNGGNAGLLVRVSNPNVGADRFNGYEVSLNGSEHQLILGKHVQNWQSLTNVPVPVSVGEWHRLRVTMSGPRLQVFLDGETKPRIDFTDRSNPLLTGGIALRTWQVGAEFRDVRADGVAVSPVLKQIGVSGMWSPVGSGEFALEANAFNGVQCQKIVHGSSSGAVGVANHGLNRWGIAVRRRIAMEGRVYLRGDVPRAIVALQSADGSQTYASQRLPVGRSWSKASFRLTPNTTDPNARFAILTDRPGTLWVDQAVLMGGDRFHGLPIRGDIARAMVEEGLTFIRYGGSMINASGYRWKKMIGDPDRRPPYDGTWYPYSTNGFGIFDFLRFCEAARLGAAFAINIEEKPEDAADLADYLTAPVTNPWGKRRAEDGHPAPYRIEYLEIGNEEGLGNERRAAMGHYAERFRLLSRAIHGRNPKLKLVCSAWWTQGAPEMKTVFDAIDGEAAAWDIHVSSDPADAGTSIGRDLDAIQRQFKAWNPQTNLKVVVFEENGGRHDMQRALGHATTLFATCGRGDFVLADCPANALQPLEQNDNGWDQGQVFFTPDRVWFMPPADAHQMLASNALPLHVAASAEGGIDVLASRSEDGKTLALSVVNVSDQPVTVAVSLGGFNARRYRAQTLAGELTAVNTSDRKTVAPVNSSGVVKDNAATLSLPPHSLTTVRFVRQ